MATKGTSEREEEDIFSDDEELEEGDEFGDDSYEQPQTLDKDAIRKEIEDSIIEALTNGDTKSGVYKGLQRELNKRFNEVKQRDAELAQTRQALAGVIQRLQVAEGSSGQVEFLTNTLKELLDDDSRKLFEDKLDRFGAEQKRRLTEAKLESILSREQVPFDTRNMPMYGRETEEEERQIAEYRKKATTQLKTFVKKMGVDPDAKGLDFGDEDEALVVRMDKLAASIERIGDEQDDATVASVRKKANLPNTRTRETSAPKGNAQYGDSAFDRGVADMVRNLRKL